MAKKIIVASGKGGVGKSSLTAGIAIALSDMGLKTLVIDFDIGMGCLDLLLSSDDTGIFNWGDVINGTCESEDAIRKTMGLSLLAAPPDFEASFTKEAVQKMVKTYERNLEFDYILFDAPAGVRGGFRLAAACADEGIIISTPDEVCVRVGLYAADILYSYGLKKVHLIINRFNKKLTLNGLYLNIDDVIDATRLQLIGIVPEDSDLAYCSVVGMTTLELCPAKTAFAKIAKRLEGKNVKLNYRKL